MDLMIDAFPTTLI